MTAPQPQSIVSSIIDEINVALVESNGYLAIDSQDIVAWDSALRKVEKTQPELSALTRALWCVLLGDVVGMEGAIADARKAGAYSEHVLEVQTVGYTNLGYGTKGLAAFRRIVDIRNLNIASGIRAGVACAAFSRIEALAVQAENARLDLSMLQALPDWRRAALAIAHQGMTDDECARIVDIAGEVLRSRSLFWLDRAPGVISNGIDHPVILNMRVATTPEDASAMTLEVVDKLCAAELQGSSFLISFTGVKI